MKLQVTQENLSKALNTVSRIASSRSTLPILSNILIKTSGKRLSVSATNLEIAINQFVGSKIEKEGSITIPARLMQEFITTLPPAVITLELEENKLHITAEKYTSTINGISAEEYPIMPTITKGQNLQIPAKVLKRTLQQVLAAASSDEARPTLTGLYLHTNEGQLFAVCTDSYRLAEKVVSPQTQPVDLLIPASSMNDLLRIISDEDEQVEIIYDDQQMLCKVGDTELVTRLIEGKYPDYKKLIPTKFEINATVKREDLINIAKVSSLFAKESAGSITIHITNKEVSIKSIASQLGENTASAEAKTSGTGDITLNSRYLLDALQVMSGEEAQISFNSKLEPCIIKDPAQKDYLHVIMPLKS